MSHNPNVPLWEQPGFVPLSPAIDLDDETARVECLLAFPHMREVQRDIWAAMLRNRLEHSQPTTPGAAAMKAG